MFSLVAHLSGMLMLLGIQPVTQLIAPDFPCCSLSCCPRVSEQIELRSRDVQTKEGDVEWQLLDSWISLYALGKHERQAHQGLGKSMSLSLCLTQYGKCP